jgi:hypothetical protein
MTTLIALASKHAVVVGADSLGTQTRNMLDPFQVAKYFNPEDDFRLRINSDGGPALSDFSQLYKETEPVPYNQLLHMKKLFKLGKLPIAVMFTGISSIGTHTIRWLVSEFSKRNSKIVDEDYTVKGIATCFLRFLREYYEEEFQQGFEQPGLELLLAGYDKNETWPAIVRVDVQDNSVEVAFSAGEFGIAFAGQVDWIQRIVFGTDVNNKIRLMLRTRTLMDMYRERLLQHLRSEGYNGTLPESTDFGDELGLFDDWNLDQLQASWEEFSEQNAINCVDFFLRIMIQAQDISLQLPTVGGDVHIAVIRKDGYHQVTKEVWQHQGHEVVTPEDG